MELSQPSRMGKIWTRVGFVLLASTLASVTLAWATFLGWLIMKVAVLF